MRNMFEELSFLELQNATPSPREGGCPAKGKPGQVFTWHTLENAMDAGHNSRLAIVTWQKVADKCGWFLADRVSVKIQFIAGVR